MIKNIVLGQVLLLVTFFMLSGCASALKKQCETQNWYEYGKARSSSGQTLESDPYPNSCLTEEISPNQAEIQKGFEDGRKNYCKVDTFQVAGLNGDLSPADTICAAAERANYSKSYLKGLEAHCTKQGAYKRGLAAKPNHKICNPKLQMSYDQNYQLGFSQYLKKEISTREIRNLQIEQRLDQIQKDSPGWEVSAARQTYLNQKKDKTSAELTESIFKDNYVQKLADAKDEKESLLEEKLRVSSEILELKVKLNQSDSLVIPVVPGALDSE